MTQDMKTIYGHQATGSCGLTEEARKCALRGANMSSCFANFILRFAAVLLLMVVGVSGVKAQTGTDYSGIYYFINCGSGKTDPVDPKIANITNSDDYFYLVPADAPQQDNKRDAWFSSDYSIAIGNSETPYLTTYKTKKDAADIPTGVIVRSHNSVWIVEFVSTDSGTDYYHIIHVVTGKYVVYEPPYSTKTNRKSVHLLTTDSPGENSKFAITNHSGNYNFRPKSISNGNRYLNAANANYNFYYSSDGTADGDANYFRGLVGLWKDAGDGSDWKPEATLFDAPAISKVSANNTITITDNNNLPNCTIRYTIGDGSQAAPTATTGEQYDPLNPPVITTETNVKAAVFAYGVRVSGISNAMLNQRIMLSDESLVYNGLEREPAVTLKYGDNTIPAEEYDVEYSDNTAAGTATVTVTNKAGGDFYVITDSKEFEITKASLTVTANPKEITYGETPANDGVTYGAFAGEDTESVLTGVLTYSYNYEQYGDVGSYTITPSGLTGDNYEITFAAGTLTVNQREVGLDWGETSFTYNGNSQAPAATATNLVNSDEISVTVTGAQTNAGNYAATATALTGTKAGNYSLPDPATHAFTIAQKSVTVTSGITASDKTYDGTTNADLDCTNAVFEGKIENDDLIIGFASGTFADKNVGTGKTVNISGLTLGGTAAGNYSLAAIGQQETATADITVKEVTASGTITANNKAYDGTTDAELVYTGVTLTGKVEGDNLTVSATGVFADKNVGTGKTVNISEWVLDGTDKDNYIMASSGQPTTTTADITAAEITVSGITAENKAYDGNTTAILVYTNATLMGKVEGDNLTITATGLFDNKNVGTDKDVTISGLTLGGSDASNYVLAATGQQATSTADITAKDITASGTITASIKEYDGNTSATLDISDVTLTGVVDGDDIAFTATGTFADKNVGTGKTVTIGLALSGNDAGNYNITSPSIPTSTTADITVREVTASGTITANNKAYDGTTDAELVYTGVTLTGKVEGDNLTVSATGVFADKNVGTGKTVNISEWVLDGTDKDNYIMASSGQPTTTTADITAAEITVSGITAENKAYDGNTTAILVYTNATLMGKVEGDNLTITATGLFDNKNVGTDKTVTISGLALDGTDKDNYQLATSGQQEATTANITAKDVTVSGITAENKEYDGNTTATLVYTGVTFNGKLDGETLEVTATGAFEDKNVGTDKTVNISDLALDGTDKDNYQLATSGQQETTTANITPATATVTADDKTKGFGDADPTFTATVTGLKNGDDESVLAFTFSRVEGEDVGGYTITPSGDAEQGNYNVTYATGTLTITAKSIGSGTTPAEGIDIDIVYDGENYSVTVKQGDNTIATTNYTYSGAYDQDHPENYVVTVTGQGNYTNSAKATYTRLTFYDTTPDDATKGTTAAVYCATQNLKVNESFKAYYVTNLENNVLTITKVEAGENKKNYIVANQPMILISDDATAPKGFTVKPYTDAEVVTIPDTGEEGSNLLKVVTDEGGKQVALAEVYMFSQGEFVLTKAGTMSKGKFYLENPNYNTPSPSRGSLRIVSDDTTGFTTSPHIDTDSEIIDTWYTIGGQKLNKKPTRKGLYLQNGQKVVIK